MDIIIFNIEGEIENLKNIISDNKNLEEEIYKHRLEIDSQKEFIKTENKNIREKINLLKNLRNDVRKSEKDLEKTRDVRDMAEETLRILIEENKKLNQELVNLYS
jgi:chromosome segregation ATPase